MPRFLRYGLLVVILFLIVLRFLSLDLDPPIFFKGFTQAHLTDPYHLTFFSRNAVLFDEWNPFDFHRWDVFKYSLVSGFSYIIFSMFGVSRTTANISAVILNLVGCLLFLYGLYPLRPNREIIFTATLLFISSMLFFYGRMPFLENGLIFISGFIFLFFMKTDDKWWGQLLTGVLIALGALAGKLFGFILLGPVILALIYRYRTGFYLPALRVLAGIALGTVLYILVFYGGSTTILKNYYLEQTIGMYGSYLGLTSPMLLLQKLLTYGGAVGLFELSPFFLSTAGLSLIIFTLTGVPKEPFRRESLPLVFAVGWLLCGILGLMPFNYRPLRYALFMFLPMSLMIACTAALLLNSKIRMFLYNKWLTLPIIFLVFWYIFTHIPMMTVHHSKALTMGKSAIPYTFILSLILTVIIYLWLKNRPRVLSGKKLMVLFVPILAALMINQGWLLYRGMLHSGKYLKEYSIELGQIVNSNAVITGPYAPAFTIDNNLKGIVYHFGLSNVEHDLFDRFPITHVVSDLTNWDHAKADFPNLNQAHELARYIVRDFSGRIYRLASANISLTDYEQGKIMMEGGQADSAVVFFRKFALKYPDNLFGIFGLAESYKAADRMKECFELINSMVKRYPDNFRVHVFCTNLFLDIYRKSKEEDFKKLAGYHYKRAHELNPALDQNTE